MKIAVAQINTTVGDFDGNFAKIAGRIEAAEKDGVDLIVFPEMAVTSYPPNDLLEDESFIAGSLRTVEKIARRCVKIAAIVGFPSVNKSKTGKGVFNSAAFLSGGKIKFVQHKALLPTYDVFDEARYFEPGTEHRVYPFNGSKIGITICEDVWSEVIFSGRKLYRYNPVKELVKKGAELVINISASPFHVGKDKIRKDLLAKAARRNKVPIIYANAVGGNDELVFDGHSIVVDKKGQLVYEGACFKEGSFIVEFDRKTGALACSGGAVQKGTESEVGQLHQALTLGLSDYVKKSLFKKVVIGLSGGIDSAVVAALAVEAVGSKNVLGVSMPSPFSSEGSVKDAKKLAGNLGIKFEIIPIADIYNSYLRTLNLAGDAEHAVSLAEENIQARIRGNILMAISNRTGALVLSTGNKSELAVGYCTLYGDMAGGFAVISDVPKTSVYKLAGHINLEREIIPLATIVKEPSAELRPNQKDADSLPPYEILDEILKLYIEDRASISAIVKKGIDRKITEEIVKKVNRNEYKRRQAAPGIKVTSKSLGAGRRYPIVWKY